MDDVRDPLAERPLAARAGAPRSAITLDGTRLPVAQADFARSLAAHGLGALARERVRTVQVNVGKRCNLACLHCHVDAGPSRVEELSDDTAARVIELVEASPSVDTVDLTGGAPELNPSFRRLVEGARRLGRRVGDRCNLTVLFEPGLEDLPSFLAAHEVQIIASLPCHGPENVGRQRGKGVFEASVRALQRLNDLGYGRHDSPLVLRLVYNPLGPSLPPPQAALEEAYRAELRRRYAIEFSSLLTITNLPIARFAHALERDGRLRAYEQLLVERFNPRTVPALMCRSMVSVAWTGALHDCDFHQMLELPLADRPRSIWELRSFEELEGIPIRTAAHCFGCTAGAGSSCGGSLS